MGSPSPTRVTPMHVAPLHVVQDVDVVVLGAGLAGLCTARHIVETASGAPVRVAVVEASDRVGGRNLTERVGARGTPFDLGGQWVGPTHTELLALAAELGVSTAKQYCTGRKVLDLKGSVSTYSSDIPTPLGVSSLLDVQQLMLRTEHARKQVPPGKPWECPRAAEWDAVTVATMLNKWSYTAAGAGLFASAVRGVFGVEPADLSFLHFLNYVNSAGSMEALVTIAGGFQDSTFEGGAQQLSVRLAERLRDQGVLVYLGCPARSVEQSGGGGGGGGVVVRCDRRTVRAQRCVVAMPPSSASKITFTPAMPHPREQLMRRSFMGCIIKTIVLYQEAFWRDAGYSGEVVCDNASGPAFNVYDDSLALAGGDSGDGGTSSGGSGQGAVQPALVVFTNAHPAAYWAMATPAERRTAILAQLSKWFGPKAAHPVEYVEKNWLEDPHTRGCPIAVWSPGALVPYGRALREPVGRVHWAGTETAEVAMGFMEGAVRSGHRAGAEVLAALRGVGGIGSGTIGGVSGDEGVWSQQAYATRVAGPNPFRAQPPTLRARALVAAWALLKLNVVACVLLVVVSLLAEIVFGVDVIGVALGHADSALVMLVEWAPYTESYVSTGRQVGMAWLGPVLDSLRSGNEAAAVVGVANVGAAAAAGGVGAEL